MRPFDLISSLALVKATTFSSRSIGDSSQKFFVFILTCASRAQHVPTYEQLSAVRWAHERKGKSEGIYMSKTPTRRNCAYSTNAVNLLRTMPIVILIFAIPHDFREGIVIINITESPRKPASSRLVCFKDHDKTAKNNGKRSHFKASIGNSINKKPNRKLRIEQISPLNYLLNRPKQFLQSSTMQKSTPVLH
jgi:hypothetical protein